MWSRFEIVAWVNKQLSCYIYKIEELCTGAVYCCLMDKLYPGIINMEKVKIRANLEYEFLANFRLVQNALDLVKVNTQIPMIKLARGKIMDNLEFSCWFRRFFETNYKKPFRPDYDPLAARGHQFIGMGPSRKLTSSELKDMRRHRRSVRISISHRDIAKQKEEHVGDHIGDGDQLRLKTVPSG